MSTVTTWIRLVTSEDGYSHEAAFKSNMGSGVSVGCDREYVVNNDSGSGPDWEVAIECFAWQLAFIAVDMLTKLAEPIPHESDWLVERGLSACPVLDDDMLAALRAYVASVQAWDTRVTEAMQR